MKKIISLSTFVLSVAVYLFVLYYVKLPSFDYDIAQFIVYVFYWSVALFILSLLAAVLDIKKYKIWLCVSLIYVLISLRIALNVGDGNGQIFSFDGKLETIFLASVYSFASIVYFVVQFFKNKKK